MATAGRKNFTNGVKAKRFAYAQGCCEKCQRRLKANEAEYDHDHADGLGGPATFENCRVLCPECHSVKTHGTDRPMMQKSDSVSKKHAGITKPTSKFSKRGRAINDLARELHGQPGYERMSDARAEAERRLA